ncbi:MAG: hypothetical protein IPP69_05375 [Flavobacteriales bacterium]|nr:hypothetical protein [Flavobacteriales bacterium]
MKIFHHKLYIISLLLLIFSCKKKEDNPVAPVIEFKNISGTEVEQFNNNLQINLTYEDYQGDLGNADPDVLTLRVKDSRLSDYDWYHVPPMTPNNEELHIKGSYSIELDPLFLMGNGTQEQTSFSVEIRDRAGNWSNAIRTPNVLIVDSL